MLAESKGGHRGIGIFYYELEMGRIQTTETCKKVFALQKVHSSLLVSKVLNKATTDAATSNLFPRKEEPTFF